MTEMSKTRIVLMVICIAAGKRVFHLKIDFSFRTIELKVKSLRFKKKLISEKQPKSYNCNINYFN